LPDCPALPYAPCKGNPSREYALNKEVKAMLERDDIRKNIASMGARAD
jgi:hypothetical protein